MKAEKTIIEQSNQLFNYDASALFTKYSSLSEVVRTGFIINDIVSRYIFHRYMSCFINKVMKFGMRDSELVKLYAQLAAYAISNVDTSYLINDHLADIQKKVKDFNNWSIMTVFDGDLSVEGTMLMEAGVYPICIELPRDDCCYEQYIYKGTAPNENRVDHYIMRNIPQQYQNPGVAAILTGDLILTGEASQFDILPRTKIIQAKFACFQKCVMHLETRNMDKAQHVLNIKRGLMYWYHNGYKIQCDHLNEFNMFSVGKILDEIINARA